MTSPLDEQTVQPPLLRVCGVVKLFPGVRALDGVDLTLECGEVHALMGENGAGKSTLIKAITGVLRPEHGSIELEGQPIHPRSVRDAERLGISTVYQEINLIPMRSVAENLLLGRFPKRFGLVRWKQVRRIAEGELGRFGLSIDVTRPVSSYSVAIQQMVAIVRALGTEDGPRTDEQRAKVLILDEPTSSLDAAEAEHLFTVLRNLKRRGLAILFVTHFLDQVYAISDRITVLRNGRYVGTWLARELPKLSLVSAMTGRSIKAVTEEHREAAACEAESTSPPLLEAVNLARRGSIHPISFSIARGEAVGLAGLLGSGRTETARLCFGVDAPDAGELRIDGQPTRFTSPRQAIGRGIGMTSEDRKATGIIPNLSLRENIIVALQSRRGIFRRLSRKRQQQIADQYIRLLGIRTPSGEQPIRLLSGGNQQKALLARWLATNPRLLILDEPTRGIDVGAKAEIARLIRSLCREGLSALFISSELEEVVDICRHVIVLRDRRNIGQLRGDDVTEQRILQLIAGEEAAASEGKEQ